MRYVLNGYLREATCRGRRPSSGPSAGCPRAPACPQRWWPSPSPGSGPGSPAASGTSCPLRSPAAGTRARKGNVNIEAESRSLGRGGGAKRQRRLTTCCCTSEQTTLRPPTCTSRGLARILRASASMALGKVAENITVWRSGRTLSTMRITWTGKRRSMRLLALGLTFLKITAIYIDDIYLDK